MEARMGKQCRRWNRIRFNGLRQLIDKHESVRMRATQRKGDSLSRSEVDVSKRIAIKSCAMQPAGTAFSFKMYLNT
jgi:hypothetical protein